MYVNTAQDQDSYCFSFIFLYNFFLLTASWYLHFILEYTYVPQNVFNIPEAAVVLHAHTAAAVVFEIKLPLFIRTCVVFI